MFHLVAEATEKRDRLLVEFVAQVSPNASQVRQPERFQEVLRWIRMAHGHR